MGTINKPHTFVGDTKAKASEVNATFDEIYNEFNGNIDEYNLNLNRLEFKSALADALKENIGKMMYPIGSIYYNSENPANPSDLLGFGSWSKFSEGRVLVGHDSTDTDFDTGEKTGGEKTHTLTDAEMPSHNHNGSTSTNGSHNHDYTRDSFSNRSSLSHHYGVQTRASTDQTSTEGTHNHSFTTSTAGSDNAHNNLQPYITVYMWKRIA